MTHCLLKVSSYVFHDTATYGITTSSTTGVKFEILITSVAYYGYIYHHLLLISA